MRFTWQRRMGIRMKSVSRRKRFGSTSIVNHTHGTRTIKIVQKQ